MGTFSVRGPMPVPVYTGPGDLVSGASAWWGLRAYSSAAAGSAAVRLIRSSDSTQADISTLASGALNTSDAFFNASTYKIVTLYDQTGNGRHITQGTDANRPTFTLNGLGSLPIISFAGTPQTLTIVSFGSVLSQPYSISTVVKRTGAFTSQQGIIISSTVSGLYFKAAADTVFMYAGITTPQVAAADNTWHAIQGVFNGASSSLDVDGSTVTGDTGTDSFGSGIASVSSNVEMTASLVEIGVWPSGFSSGQITSIKTNQSVYWGV